MALLPLFGHDAVSVNPEPTLNTLLALYCLPYEGSTNLNEDLLVFLGSSLGVEGCAISSGPKHR